MARFKQVVGGILAGVVTLGVAVAAAYALWLGAPLLNPGGDRFGASDIPIINTDAKILVPIPEKTHVSPRAGVIRPTPPAPKPKPQRAVNTSPSKRHSVLKVTRVVTEASKPRHATKVAEASAHDNDGDERTSRSKDSGRDHDSDNSESSKESDSAKRDSKRES